MYSGEKKKTHRWGACAGPAQAYGIKNFLLEVFDAVLEVRRRLPIEEY